MGKNKFSMNKLFWGLLFIAGAVVLILSNLGMFPEVSFFRIILTILFVAMLVQGLSRINFSEILFSLAFLACIYDEWLHITTLTPWTVLGAALLGSIGLDLLFPKRSKWHIHHHSEPEIIDIPDDETIHMENSFGSSIKYINSEHFLKAHLENSFGEMKVYFDNAVAGQPRVYGQIDVSFGNMALFVPKTWLVDNQLSCSFGAAALKNENDCIHQPDGPVLVLQGDVSFGAVQIYYV